jgi:uncharacterized protein
MIFVDTSFWAALGNIADDRHEDAKRLWAGKPSVVVTSNHVMGETSWVRRGPLLNRRCGHRVAASAAAIRHSAVVRVEHVTAKLERRRGNGWTSVTNENTRLWTRPRMIKGLPRKTSAASLSRLHRTAVSASSSVNAPT